MTSRDRVGRVEHLTRILRSSHPIKLGNLPDPRVRVGRVNSIGLKPNSTITLIILHIKKYFCLQFKKQEMLIRILFLYNRVELNILLLHLKDFSSLKKLLFVTIIKIKIAKDKITCKVLILNLLKNNKIIITKKIINIYKYKNCKYINKNKEKCYLSSNKHFKLN